ncbi:uncharacterized protein B0P05DRAFT_531892 [Gilbertella persicaria]|uniref:uncharacterized protein n=1 Tax=Gilbertella persicaria TaxID=101096 RepID=UPI0022204BC6|nr:uncharacterized protein B0P05DRAFT_531892 [Gilbertella persicaria]KAI8087677.1 hypothetical protein B0P05DRAFT_531892 [Gilbertella persicaria]
MTIEKEVKKYIEGCRKRGSQAIQSIQKVSVLYRQCPNNNLFIKKNDTHLFLS